MIDLEDEIAEILVRHQKWTIDKDCDEGCCAQYFCECGAPLDGDPISDIGLPLHQARLILSVIASRQS